MYGTEIGLDLSAVAPRPPLAVNLNLTGSARFHADEMLGHSGDFPEPTDVFSHVSPVSGIGPNQMAVDNGYDLFGDGLGMNWGTVNNIESIAFGLNQIATYPAALELLIIDDGVPGFGHRVHLLAKSDGFAEHGEVGFGRAGAGPLRYYAIHSGYKSLADLFVTGVAYRDANGNGRYDRGEGLPGVTVDVGGAQTTTLAEGGYSLAAAPGSHLVTCSGGTFAGESIALVDVVDANVEVDCIEGLPVAEVDFAFQTGDEPALLDVDISANFDSGAAPLDVDFDALGGTAGTVFFWDFGDGSGGVGSSASHSFAGPGLFPVLLRGIDSTGIGAALHLVSVGGAGGAGPGTTPPGDATLVAEKVALKRNLKKTGKDSAKLVARVELPAGFQPGAHAVEVSVAGATLPFLLDEKNKGADEAGNKVKLKYKRPKGDPPLEAGVSAKLTVKLKGDLASELEAAGIHDATEEGVLADVPFAFLLNELVYRGDAQLSFKSKQGKKGKAKLLP